jgi:hypothetical protein
VTKKIDPPLRMTTNDASVKFPRDYILMQMDDYSPSNDMGTVLYIGDDLKDMYALEDSLNMENCLVFEGSILQSSLGGIVVGT